MSDTLSNLSVKIFTKNHNIDSQRLQARRSYEASGMNIHIKTRAINQLRMRERDRGKQRETEKKKKKRERQTDRKKERKTDREILQTILQDFTEKTKK